MVELSVMVIVVWEIVDHLLRSIEECGIKSDPPSARIIGGADVTSHSWPFAVFIRQSYRNLITSDGMSYLVEEIRLWKSIVL